MYFTEFYYVVNSLIPYSCRQQLLLRKSNLFLHSEPADGDPPLPDNATPRPHLPMNGEISKSPQPSFNQSHCKPLHPSAMFFIRIPKCASTSFIEVLRKLSKVNGNFEMVFHPSGAFNWDTDTKSKVANLAKSKARSGRQFVYARHFYHVDFHEFGLENYTYVTLIRDPVSRLVSSYLYYHFSSKPHIQRILNPRHRNETLEECLDGEHDGCKRNLMTKYFCGHMHLCGLGDRRALERAKENLRTQFAAVGIIEHTDVTMRVFKTILPEYFRGLDPSHEVLPLLNPNEHHLSLNSTLVHTIEDANYADVELYNYARSLLFQRASDCGVLHS